MKKKNLKDENIFKEHYQAYLISSFKNIFIGFFMLMKVTHVDSENGILRKNIKEEM